MNLTKEQKETITWFLFYGIHVIPVLYLVTYLFTQDPLAGHISLISSSIGIAVYGLSALLLGNIYFWFKKFTIHPLGVFYQMQGIPARIVGAVIFLIGYLLTKNIYTQFFQLTLT